MMQFNIEYGGHGVDFSSVAKAIHAASADVVAVQEACATMPEIAADLGWPSWDARTQVVSKFPLITPQPVRRGSILVEVEPGQVFVVVNIHPPSRGYGPSAAERGLKPRALVRRERRIRMPDLDMALQAADELRAQGMAVVVLGDFNTPSHRDWTQECVGQRPHLKSAVAWPLSVALEEDGFADVYRTIYPDPVRDPGLTWPAKRPFVKGYNPGLNDQAADRIDLMFTTPNITPRSMTIVGERESKFTQIAVEPWPTDHRALVAELDIDLADVPVVVSVDRRMCDQGETVTVRSTGDASKQEIAVVPMGSRDLSASSISEDVGALGVTHLSTSGLLPDAYDVVLHTDGTELSRAQLWVRAKGGSPIVRTNKGKYLEGEPIIAMWEYGPGNKSDIIAIMEAGAEPLNGRTVLWEYVMGEVTGTFTFDKRLRPKRWPLPAGNYILALLQDDSSITLAQQPFAVASIAQ
jgi:endonuclease/exonuclease/phosphatase family metal-dependent hydrolase